MLSLLCHLCNACYPLQVEAYTQPTKNQVGALAYLPEQGTTSFAVADNTGLITLWSSRPYPFLVITQWRCFRSEKAADSVPVVTSMCYVPETSRLYCVDDSGYVSAWQMEPVLTDWFEDTERCRGLHSEVPPPPRPHRSLGR